MAEEVVVEERTEAVGWRARWEAVRTALTDARKAYCAYRTIRWGRQYGYSVSLIVDLSVRERSVLRMVDRIADGEPTHEVRSQAVRVPTQPTLPNVEPRPLKVAPPD